MKKLIENIFKKMKSSVGKSVLGIILFSIFYFQFSIQSSAQTKIHASATIDSTKIKIGEQLHLILSAEVSSDIKIYFPQIPDSLNHVEVVERTKIDTVKSEDGKYSTYKQTLTLTSFDAGQYFLEPFKFYYQNASKTIDSIATEALQFQVETILVDTTKEFKDVKPPMDVPFTLKEALPYIVGGIILVAIIILAIWLIRKWQRQKGIIKPNIPLRPAHEIALEELKKVQLENLWQQGFYKQYQSSVSDIVRTYIEQRFSIQAMEMPSDETLQHFKGKNKKHISKDAFEKLKYILQLADTVKFAKAIPLGTENEQSLQNAFDFVQLTKQASKSDFDSIENHSSEERKEDVNVQ